MREASVRRTVTDTDSYAFFVNQSNANEGSPAVTSKPGMRYILSLSLGVLALIANARQITPNEAQSIAQDFFNDTTIEQIYAPCAIGTRSLNAAQDYENAPYYIFKPSDNKGFVIISGDDRLPQILGYSNENVFDYNLFNLQCPLYSVNLKELIYKSSFPKEQSNLRTTPKYVLPLLKTAWGQGSPYNYLTPVLYDGSHCATGCTNTAQAQIMKFWEFPSSGSGSVRYEWNNQILSLDFSSSQYQWDAMLESYEFGFSEENANAVAVLMRDCGYANHTSYSGESGATVHYDALVRNFGYDKGIRIIDPHMCSQQYFVDAMRKELDAGRPFFVSGTISDIPGITAHSFICDGYDENGYFHFNLGWNGANDGYYLPTIGWDISCIEIGIQPDCGGVATMTFGSKYDFMYDNGKISCELDFYNPLGIFYDPYGEVYNEVATIAENMSTHDFYSFTKRKGTEFSIIYDMPLPSKLPDGDYLVYPALRFSDGQWNKFTFYDGRQEAISLSVINGSYKYSNIDVTDKLDDGKIEVDGIFYILNEDHTATVTYKNNKYNSYKGCVTIPNTISYDGIIYDVVELGIDAFRDSKLDELVVGNDIRVINEGAMSCSVNKLTFSQPSKLKEIIGWGFNNCEVPKIELPYGLETIGRCAFQNTGAASIDIPSTVKNITGGFAFTYCRSLEEVYVHWENKADLPNLNPYDHIFDQCNWNSLKLYVPIGSAAIYSSSPQWQDLNIFEHENSGIANIQEDSDNRIISIFNLLGIQIYQGNPQFIPSLPHGIYLIKLGNKTMKIKI